MTDLFVVTLSASLAFDAQICVHRLVVSLYLMEVCILCQNLLYYYVQLVFWGYVTPDPQNRMGCPLGFPYYT